MIRGAYNVYPREIEKVLYEHPDVREAAVIGLPHDELGEEVAAAVALKADADCSSRDLQDFVKRRVAAYKYPGTSGSSTSSPRAPPARSSSARSNRRLVHMRTSVEGRRGLHLSDPRFTLSARSAAREGQVPAAAWRPRRDGSAARPR